MLVVGLGNPGAEFAHTRHNVGAEAVASLAARVGVTLRAERGTAARVAVTERTGALVALAIPETFMNDSGLAVAQLCRRHSLTELSRLVVVHDELDLDPGVVRVKLGGGTAGHNGLRSIDAHLHSLDFARVRIGIGKPPGRMPGADYVLRRPSGADAEVLALGVSLAADALELVITEGLERAMNVVNVR